jgi:hypothetical protein
VAPWDHIALPRPDGDELEVTSVPARHGPDGTTDITGEVTGFVLSGAGIPIISISGDNASLDVVRAVAGRFPRIDAPCRSRAPRARRSSTGI